MKAFRLGLVLGLLVFNSAQLWANVIITSPTGGNNVSADKALNSTSLLTRTAAFGVSYLNLSMNVAGTITIQLPPI